MWCMVCIRAYTCLCMLYTYPNTLAIGYRMNSTRKHWMSSPHVSSTDFIDRWCHVNYTATPEQQHESKIHYCHMVIFLSLLFRSKSHLHLCTLHLSCYIVCSMILPADWDMFTTQSYAYKHILVSLYPPKKLNSKNETHYIYTVAKSIQFPMKIADYIDSIGHNNIHRYITHLGR